MVIATAVVDEVGGSFARRCGPADVGRPTARPADAGRAPGWVVRWLGGGWGIAGLRTTESELDDDQEEELDDDPTPPDSSSTIKSSS